MDYNASITMKKYLVHLLAGLLMASASYAQTNSTLSISVGAASPYGDFGSTDIKNPLSGAAKLGATLDISYAYKITKILGITGLVRTQMNATNTDVLANELKTQAGDNRKMESTSWLSGSALVGWTFGIPITENFSIETRAMMGYSRIASPKVTISNDSGYTFTHTSSTGAFSYLLGGGLKYNLSERLCVMANVDYFNAYAEFREVDVTITGPADPLLPSTQTGFAFIDNLPLDKLDKRKLSDLEKRNFVQSVETLNVTVGVGLRF